MEIFLVGGCVRDKLLGLEIKDIDYVVVGGEPEYFIKNGYQQVGNDFPVFLHPETREEYALARKERKIGDGYNGFVCDYDKTITLQEDLFRRDLTINALAEDFNGKIIDHFNGLKDLNDKILRHVSDHFKEDPLRVLRIARFMARYEPLGFSIAEETKVLMKEMVANGELNHLTKERVVLETEKAFKEPKPSAYFLTLRECGALKVIFPDVDKLFGIPQTEKYHPEIDTGIHVMMVLEQAKKLSNSDINIMWAALTHDLGKGITPEHILPKHIGHEKAGVPLVKKFFEDLKINAYAKQLAMLNCEYHLLSHSALELNASSILNVFEKFDYFRRPNIFNDFLITCEADARGRTGFENRDYPQFDFLKLVAAEVNNFDKKSLIAKIEETTEIKSEVIPKIKNAIKNARINQIQNAISIFGKNKDKTLNKFNFLNDLSLFENQMQLLFNITKLEKGSFLRNIIFDYYNVEDKTISLIDKLSDKLKSIDPISIRDSLPKNQYSQIGSIIKEKQISILNDIFENKKSKKNKINQKIS